MNLDELKKRNAAYTTLTLEDGSAWRVKKLSAAVGIAIGKAFQAAGHTDPNGAEPSTDELLNAYSLLLSNVLCDEAGVLTLDTDEGRDELKKLDMATILELGEKAQEACMGTAKKN
jgi:hypothetical protein